MGVGRPSRESRLPLSNGEAGWEVLLLRMSSAVRPASEPWAAGVGSGAVEAEAGGDPGRISGWLRARFPT